MATDDVPSGSPPAYRSGYESLTEETTATLSVEGSIPGWLDGTLIRNGPGLFEVGDRSVEHWFDGLAMLRRFEFGDGGVSYANRFLRTEALRAAREGDFGANGFAETPEKGLLGRLLGALSLDPTDNANADVARIAGRYVALTESPRAVEFDPRTLETRDHVQWADDLPVGHTTPHLERDPGGGGVLGYLTSFLPESAYHVFRIPDAGPPRRERVGTVGVENPAYMHSFALTAEHVVLTEMPFVLPPRRLLSPREEPLLGRYEWRPHQMTRFVVMDRGSGEVVTEHRVPPFVVFHHVNAHREGDALVVDLLAFDSPSVLNGMYLDRLRDAPPSSGGGGELRRYRLPLSGGDPTGETVAEDLALPRIRPDRRGRPYRYVYAQDSRAEGPPRGIARVDVESGDRRTWWDEAGYAGEPVFVPVPDGAAADDGVLLVETLVPDRDRSELVVLDAGSMAERGRAAAPHRLPFGFHGQYFPATGAGSDRG